MSKHDCSKKLLLSSIQLDRKMSLDQPYLKQQTKALLPNKPNIYKNNFKPLISKYSLQSRITKDCPLHPTRKHFQHLKIDEAIRISVIYISIQGQEYYLP